MPWPEASVVKLRHEFVLKALEPFANIAALSREYGISRKTAYKWIKRFKEQGVVGLEDISRRPHGSPLRASGDVVLKILELRTQYPRWGPKKLRVVLERSVDEEEVPSVRTIARVLERAGLVTRRRKKAPLPCDVDLVLGTCSRPMRAPELARATVARGLRVRQSRTMRTPLPLQPLVPLVALALALGVACDREKSGEERMNEYQKAGIEAGAAQILAQEQARAKADAEAAAEEIVEAMARNAEAKRALMDGHDLGEADSAAGDSADSKPDPTTNPTTGAAHYRPVLLSEAPASSSIGAGDYVCKISKEYKLRPCTVRVDPQGHTILTIPEGLIALEGVIYDEGDVVHFDGWPTEARPFGCFSCDPRCTVDPSSCMCDELPPAASAHCLAQPVTFELKRKGDGWRGMMNYTTYSSRYEGEVPKRRVTGYETEVDTFVVEIKPAPGA